MEINAEYIKRAEALARAAGELARKRPRKLANIPLASATNVYDLLLKMEAAASAQGLYSALYQITRKSKYQKASIRYDKMSFNLRAKINNIHAKDVRSSRR